MLNIIIEGKTVQRTNNPCWVYYDNVLKSYMTCIYDKSEAIYIPGDGEENQGFYADIREKEIRHEGYKIADITDDDPQSRITAYDLEQFANQNGIKTRE